MLEPLDFSFFANSEIDALVSGPGRPLPSTPLFLESILQPQGPVLELGCGQGPYTLSLAERGFIMTAIALSATLTSHRKSTAEGLDIEWVEADI